MMICVWYRYYVKFKMQVKASKCQIGNDTVGEWIVVRVDRSFI